jgi:SET domain-containing protein
MNKPPHHGVFARLKPSAIHGVGVFAILNIPRGTFVFADEEEQIVWIDKMVVQSLPKPLKDLYEDFAVIKHGKYGCPTNFNLLTTSWYLNHSDQPNLAVDRNYRFYALRDIDAGEELTADYRTYSELPTP